FDSDRQPGFTPYVLFYDFRNPDKSISMSYEQALVGLDVTGGGVYVARVGHLQSSIVAATNALSSLSSLGLEVHLQPREPNLQSVNSLLSILEMWVDAPSSGNIFSVVYQHKVTQALDRKLFEVIGGSNWGK